MIDAIRRNRSFESARWILDEDSARLGLILLEYRLAIADRCNGYPQLVGAFDDLVARVLLGVGVEDLLPFLEASETLTELIEFA